MKMKFAKNIKVVFTAAVMTAVVAVSAFAVNITAITDTAVRAKSSSTGTQITTMKKGTTRKVLGSTKTWYKIKMNGKIGYVKKKYVKIAEDKPTAPTNPEKPANDIASVAREQIGKKFEMGGTGPDKFDCSGLCQYVYKTCGISIPRSTADQYVKAVKVSKKNLKNGDLVFFSSEPNGKKPSFSAIYVGNNKIVTGSSSKKVIVEDSLSGKYYTERFISGGRFQ